MFHFTCSATAAIALCSCIGELSPANDKNAELKSIWHWSKQDIARLTQVKNKGKEG